MKFKYSKLLIINKLVIFSLCLFSACVQPSEKTPPALPARQPEQLSRSKAAPEWDRLLTRNAGWFGGDGVFAIPMDGAEFRLATDKTQTLFIFSDSVVADTVGDSIRKEDFVMVHNCVAYLEGGEPDPSKFRFYIHKDEQGKPASLFVPNTPHTKKGEYYWMGDGFVNVELDSTLYLFA